MTTTTKGTAKVTLPTDTQILITREFAAPARLVWRAYTTPELIKRWWAGERGTVTSAEVDLRVGGTWRYVMTANGGFEVAFHGEYREIQEHAKLVSTEAFEGVPDPDGTAALVTVTFTETDGRTRMEMLAEHHSREIRDMVIDSGMEGGMQEGMDALEQIAVSLA
ncbi:SRPBCC family protein [Actinoplanes sp. NPDC051859]|uniref:SRPBCC family protein n=1 Tax=Actinoplanes sp. NPDC051859 TaxID=3363909 RepID=UPI0037ADF7A6